MNAGGAGKKEKISGTIGTNSKAWRHPESVWIREEGNFCENGNSVNAQCVQTKGGWESGHGGGESSGTQQVGVIISSK